MVSVTDISLTPSVCAHLACRFLSTLFSMCAEQAGCSFSEEAKADMSRCALPCSHLHGCVMGFEYLEHKAASMQTQATGASVGKCMVASACKHTLANMQLQEQARRGQTSCAGSGRGSQSKILVSHL